jgi:hypothetical protein
MISARRLARPSITSTWFSTGSLEKVEPEGVR